MSKLKIFPELMLDQSRRVMAAREMLTGLEQEYLTCLIQGRLEVWANAAHAIINLLGTAPDLPRAKRDEL